MGRCSIQIVMGPAGSGKSTYCQAIQEHAATSQQRYGPKMFIANLDPAAEVFAYEPAFDIRDLISVQEVMEELQLGPNGALLYCMEYLLENMDWLQENLDTFGDDDYLVLDCAGQIELYTHVPVQKRIIDCMRGWGYEGSMVSVFCIDAAFLIDASKFISGSLLSLSAMIALELPHVAVLTKCDLMEEEQIDRILEYGSASEIWELEQDRQSLFRTTTATSGLKNSNNNNKNNNNNTDTSAEVVVSGEERKRIRRLEQRRLERQRLTTSICGLLDDWQMVSFIPLNIKSEESLDQILLTVNQCIQYGEDVEVRAEDFDEVEDPEFNLHG